MRNQRCRVSELTGEQLEAMFALYCLHFQGVSQHCFRCDLDEKNWVILLEDDHGNLRGYSCLLMYQARFADTPYTIIYSGDTIMDPGAWSSTLLTRSWLEAVLELKQAHFPGGKLYWLLVTSGFRSYRFLSTLWQEFYPHFERETPSRRQEFLNDLAQNRFGDSYDPRTGVVRHHHNHVLRDELRDIPERRLEDEHTRFFQEINPEHAEGVELVCLTEISRENLTDLGEEVWPG